MRERERERERELERRENLIMMETRLKSLNTELNITE